MAIYGALGEVNLGALSAIISDTAVDVFVYDTSRDTDSGAWRKRTQHTSWYNETLNTATRGSRREFPSVAVIVSENSKITIYDGDDPDLPMWMVFDVGGTVWTSNNLLAQSGASTTWSIAALNGILVLGPVVSYRMRVINFVSEYVYVTSDAGGKVYNGYISERNSGKGFSDNSSIGTTVNGEFNDVAMTVLPNAPIDSATGLQVPTIAVATNGGVSVIKDDGNVVDYTYQVTTNTNASNVYLSETGRLQYSSRSISSGYVYYVEYDKLSSSDVTSAPNVVLCVSETGGSGITRILPQGSITSDAITKDYTATGYNPGSYTPYQGGVFLHKTTGDVKETDGFSLPNSNFMGLHIRPDYNTGWMYGDIKGAFLSDTDTTNVTGSELITNGDFASNSDWTARGDTGLSISGGQATITLTTTNGEIHQNLPTLSAGTYVFSVERVGGTETNIYVSLQDATSGTSRYTLLIESNISNGTYSATVTIPSTESNLRVAIYGYFWGGSHNGYTLILDNVSLRIAEEDRSVNENGLQVFGTVTKSAVATGAELVAYSGWSNSNYLQQPYNSDLDFGTGDFSVMGWIKLNSNSTVEYVISRDSYASTASRFGVYIDSDGHANFLVDDNTTDRRALGTISIDDSIWHHLVGVYDGSGGVYIYLDGILNASTTGSALNTINNSSAELAFGNYGGAGSALANGSLALWRVSASAPSAEQIKKMYEDEKVLFQENAACSLYGSSDAVTALAYDEKTELLHVGTSSGRSDFQGLRRINNTTTAVTTAISAYDGSIAQQ